VKRNLGINGVNGESKFQVECDAGSAGHIRLSAQSLTVTVGQWILRDGALEMWDSVVVSCAQDEDGALRVCGKRGFVRLTVVSSTDAISIHGGATLMARHFGEA